MFACLVLIPNLEWTFVDSDRSSPQALALPEAANQDFSIGAMPGQSFPDADAWKGMFAAATK